MTLLYSSRAKAQIVAEEAGSMVEIFHQNSTSFYGSRTADLDGRFTWRLQWMDLTPTGSDNMFMAYDGQYREIEFKASREEIRYLANWILARRKDKQALSIKLGQSTMTFTQKSLGTAIFRVESLGWSSELGFTRGIVEDLFSDEQIDRAYNPDLRR